MDNELLSSLKILVNQPSWDNIKDYVEWRQADLVRSVLQSQSFEEFKNIQGRISELDYLLKLRDLVNSEEEKFLKGRGKQR